MRTDQGVIIQSLPITQLFITTTTHIFFYYLFDKDIPYRPELVPSKASPLYIIIPHAYKGQYPGYVRFRAPDELYITQREWLLPDGTIVVKRVKK